MTPGSLALLARPDVGAAAWWSTVAAAGTPLIGDAADAVVELAFLERGAHFDAVYLDVYSHTPHPTSGPTALARIPGSDVWVWRTRLPRDWRGSYFLLPACAGQAVPAGADARALRAWWIALIRTNAQADPLNHGPAHGGGEGAPLSPLLLPRAPVHPAWRAPATHVRDVSTLQWRSARLGDDYTAWLWSTGSGAGPEGIGAPLPELPLILLLDGRRWMHEMPVAGPSAALPPAVWLLVDAGSPARRARDLACSAAFWDAVRDELLPLARAAQPFTDDPARTVVAGQSYGGLAAVYAALHYPCRFGRALSQSGSFWWPDPAHTADAGWLGRQVEAGLARGAALDIDLEAGCYETDMTGVSRAMAGTLRRAGFRVRYRRYRGGHDPLCWRDGLLHGLARLLANIQQKETA